MSSTPPNEESRIINVKISDHKSRESNLLINKNKLIRAFLGVDLIEKKKWGEVMAWRAGGSAACKRKLLERVTASADRQVE